MSVQRRSPCRHTWRGGGPQAVDTDRVGAQPPQVGKQLGTGWGRGTHRVNRGVRSDVVLRSSGKRLAVRMHGATVHGDMRNARRTGGALWCVQAPHLSV